MQDTLSLRAALGLPSASRDQRNLAHKYLYYILNFYNIFLVAVMSVIWGELSVKI